MTKRSPTSYETHFEMADRLNTTPNRIKRLAHRAKLGSYGSSGGVLYFPVKDEGMGFFVEMMRLRHFS